MDESEKKSLASYTEEERNKALELFRIIQPFIEKRGILSQIARESDIPLSTLNRWVKSYRKDGLAGLIRKSRSDCGKYHKLQEELLLLIEGLALQKPPRSMATIHRQVENVAKKKGWSAPGYQTVLKIIKRIDPGLKTLALEGDKVFKNRFDLIYRRESTRPNEVWQADHSLLDIWVFDEQEQSSQPWLTIILDDYSRAVAGYYLSFESPSILRTALALRQAIWRKVDSNWHIYGVPEIFYTDNGSDFTSRHITQLRLFPQRTLD